MKTIALLLICATGAFAEVADSGASGFTVKTTLDIAAPPADVYQKLVGNVGDWWSPRHTFSGDAHNLSIDAKPMGCFCEKITGGGVRHMEVLYAAPGRTLVMSGALGPLQSLAATGSMTITLAASGGGTKLSFSYAVAGYLATGMNSWAAPVDGMLLEQFTRFKNYVEQGDPAGRNAEKPN